MTLYRSHDTPAAGHQGIEKILERLRQQAYWVNMSQDVEKHCSECQMCQRSKLPTPTRAPLASVPIGKPWQMVAVDILEVPVSYQGHRYLLVVQDYFTKWADAIPLHNQTAATITQELISYGSSRHLTVRTLRACCYNRPLSHLEFTSPTLLLTILKETAWLNDSTDLCYSCFVAM